MELSPLSSLNPWGAPTLDGLDTSNAQVGQRIGGVKTGSNRQFVRFYKRIVPEVYATEVRINEKTGTTTILKTAVREVEKEFVQIITPGDKNSVDDVACDFHKREHWTEYRAFRDGKSAPIGTSIDECTFISTGIATELKILHCHTLEQLADASDDLCGQIPNGWEIREFARAKVKADMSNRSLDQVNALKVELARSQETMRVMQEEIKKLSGLVAPDGTRIETIKEGVAPKKKGRPRIVKPEGMNDEKNTSISS